MLLMVEKGIRGRICPSIQRNVKANNKYLQDYDKNKEFLYLSYWDVNNSYGWEMLQKFPADDLEVSKWVQVTFQFKKDFIKSYSKCSDEG